MMFDLMLGLPIHGLLNNSLPERLIVFSNVNRKMVWLILHFILYVLFELKECYLGVIGV